MKYKSKQIIAICSAFAMIFQISVFADNSSEKTAGRKPQIWKTQCGTPTGQEKFPIVSYQELPQLESANPEQWKGVKGICSAWGSIDERYAKYEVPEATSGKRLVLKGWRGEKIHSQAIVWTTRPIKNLRFQLSGLKSKSGDEIPVSNIDAGFVRYVMTDGHSPNGANNCGDRSDHTQFDSLMVADCIDHLMKETSLEEMQTQAIWLSYRIPQNITPGSYKGTVSILDGEKSIGTLSVEIIADKHSLPSPSDWKFHLDLWQNPYAVARYYQVEPWSKEHFEAMTPIMKRLADAGQKVITASIMHKPWNGQTEDPFETMVTWMRKVDGSWDFRFDVFDRWVEFMIGLGIDKQINCYSMVPWRLSFQYFDQATNTLKFMETAPGEAAYDNMWTSMLTAFAKHLKEKGWFDICTIAMDERSMDIMQKTIAVIHKASPDFKISFAGNFIPELEKGIHDYCIGVFAEYPEEIIEKRKAEGKVTTLYTCCSERHPNTFTFSAPAEAAWIGCHMAARNVDGYLRWAYNSWTLEPLLDSRFRTWAGGDTYIIYPGNRTSIRFERLIEGIQLYEKINILKKEFTATENIKALNALEEALSNLEIPEIEVRSAAEDISMIKKVIEKY